MGTILATCLEILFQNLFGTLQMVSLTIVLVNQSYLNLQNSVFTTLILACLSFCTNVFPLQYTCLRPQGPSEA